jgi:hypothetical protein
MTGKNAQQNASPLLKHGTIVIVHNLRNRFFLSDYGLHEVPLMVSAADIVYGPIYAEPFGQRVLKLILAVLVLSWSTRGATH